jgi:predicted RNA-binding Zn-ribbon protein involved in translation (DUF1610 family)
MLQNRLLIRTTLAMKSKAFHFDCPHCGLAYLAQRRARPARMSGALACVNCKKPAYHWTGFFDVTDLRIFFLPHTLAPCLTLRNRVIQSRSSDRATWRIAKGYQRKEPVKG